MDNFDDESEDILDEETDAEYEPDFIFLQPFIPMDSNDSSLSMNF